MNKERCLVIGLGQIGMGYDIDLESSEYILTHCSAISEHPNFLLVGGVDINARSCDSFEEKYSVPSYYDLHEAIRETEPTVAIICCPTSEHYSVLCTLVENSCITAIICEKPLSYDITEAKKMVELCVKNRILFYVNYMRRSDYSVIEIKRRIDSGEIAGPLKASIWYSKGIMNNGSHLLNLMTYWFGPYLGHKILNSKRSWQGSDPEPDIYIEFDRGGAVFLSAWEESFTHFTVELISPSGRLYYSNGGEKITWNGVAEDPLFSDYKVLSDKTEVFENHFLKYQYNVYQQLSNTINKKDSYLSDGYDGLYTLDVLSKICGDL